MFERILRIAALIVSALLIASFSMFAIDEFQGASKATQTAIAAQHAVRSAAPSPSDERARERAHSSARELVDDANDVLTAPFAGIVDSSPSAWTRRTVPTALALLLFGVGLGFLARFSAARAQPVHRPHLPHRSL